MANKMTEQASLDRTTVLEELDDLIQGLRRVCRTLRNRGDPSLADLWDVLKGALRLRRRIRSTTPRTNWYDVLAAIMFLAELANQICSSLFCQQPRELLMQTGTIIRMLRNAQRISQGDLAERLQVTRAYLSQVENDHRQPSLALLRGVASSLKVPLAVLVLGEKDGLDDRDIARELQGMLTRLLTIYLSKRTQFERQQTKASDEAT